MYSSSIHCTLDASSLFFIKRNLVQGRILLYASSKILYLYLRNLHSRRISSSYCASPYLKMDAVDMTYKLEAARLASRKCDTIN